ncbi:hypothetical protein ZOSMA_32G00410 [Zostera marina]|uniref:Uncharacterized protein n=1 Tax=Zostera marina TaxID=29655 RepID=A0A0K9PAJ2_ZOSMR|nr:hypothetical protein ZOSMA_32G00410 [Zostera marina]
MLGNKLGNLKHSFYKMYQCCCPMVGYSWIYFAKISKVVLQPAGCSPEAARRSPKVLDGGPSHQRMLEDRQRFWMVDRHTKGCLTIAKGSSLMSLPLKPRFCHTNLLYIVNPGLLQRTIC